MAPVACRRNCFAWPAVPAGRRMNGWTVWPSCSLSATRRRGITLTELAGMDEVVTWGEPLARPGRTERIG
jgi:hypothetical protein